MGVSRRVLDDSSSSISRSVLPGAFRMFLGVSRRGLGVFRKVLDVSRRGLGVSLGGS